MNGVLPFAHFLDAERTSVTLQPVAPVLGRLRRRVECSRLETSHSTTQVADHPVLAPEAQGSTLLASTAVGLDWSISPFNCPFSWRTTCNSPRLPISSSQA
ncbi:hypothetical protein CGRA01v4_03280 [Colletotrichum graminicola]|nr:hypothetical protein CGRA01v4_03280 [Colletotrichum graminicola]